MSESTEDLRRKISSAGELQSVVRTMKVLAASSIGQYAQSVLALVNYYRTVELGLGVCLRASGSVVATTSEQSNTDVFGVIVFGSDQGLVGRFNEVVADFVIESLAALPGQPQIWAVGERVQARLADAGMATVGLFSVPNSIQAVTPLVGQIQIESESHRAKGNYKRVYVFHNRPMTGTLYEPVSQRLLPLDAEWQERIAKVKWPTSNLPEVMGHGNAALHVLIREYHFISLFRACTESLASENASRLMAMERANRNIDELLDTLHGTFHRMRQSSIDEELFDVISGFEAFVEAHHADRPTSNRGLG